MAPKQKSQPRITALLFLEVKQPMEIVGKGRSACPEHRSGLRLRPRFGGGVAEKATIFKCVLRDHTCMHKLSNAVSPEKARQLQEMGVSRSGSLEHGDSSGDIFWLPN